MGPRRSGAAVRVTQTKKPFVKLGAFPCWLGYWRRLMKTCLFQWWGHCKNVHQRCSSHSAFSVCPCSLLIFFLPCFPCMSTWLWVCTCVLTCEWDMCVGEHTCMCTIGQSLMLFSTLFSEVVFLTEPDTHWFGLPSQLASPGNPQSLSPEHGDYRQSSLPTQLLIGPWWLNLCPHACMPSTPYIELSP